MKQSITQDVELALLSRAGVCKMSHVPRCAKSKIEAFFAEFPFCRDLVPIGSHHNGITRVYVSRLTPDVIERQIQCSIHDYHKEYLLLLNEEGQVFNHVIWREQKEKRFFFFGPIVTVKKKRVVWSRVKLQSYRPTIVDLLDDLGDGAAKVKYALSYHEFTGAVILYKTLPDMELVGYKVRMQKRIQAQYEAEIEAERIVFRDLGE